MKEFPPEFARVYNALWGDFATTIAPRIHAFSETNVPAAAANRTILDVCCGTGQLSAFFAHHGYFVIGVDNSAAMLAQAHRNLTAAGLINRAKFVHSNASEFSVQEKAALAVATGEALNHLPSKDALIQCLRRVFATLDEGGILVVDIRTRRGFACWNHVLVEEFDTGVVIKSGLYDGGETAVQRIVGFHRYDDGLYERFEQTVNNIVFDAAWLTNTLLEIGWDDVRVGAVPDLETHVDNPEERDRVTLIAAAPKLVV